MDTTRMTPQKFNNGPDGLYQCVEARTSLYTEGQVYTAFGGSLSADRLGPNRTTSSTFVFLGQTLPAHDADDLVEAAEELNNKELADSWWEEELTMLIEAGSDDMTEDRFIKQPSWYSNFEIEPIEFIMRNDLPFWQGNIIKYVVRSGLKLYPGKDSIESEIADLKKAARYIEMRLGQLTNTPVF